jgi:hypothetical protein
MKTKLVINAIIVTFFLISCNSKVIEIEDEKDSEIIAAALDEINEKSVAGFGKSQTEKEWVKLFKKCNSNVLWRKPRYLGLSIQNTIGTVLDIKAKKIKRFAPIISQEDSVNIIKVGNMQPLCEIDLEREFSFNLLFKPIIQGIQIDEIRTDIETAKEKKLTGGSYREVHIATDAFKDWIDTKAEVSYKESISDKSAVFVGKYLWVDNFEFEITASDSSALKIALDATPEISENLSLGGLLRITRQSNRRIKVRGENAMIPLVGWYKYKP